MVRARFLELESSKNVHVGRVALPRCPGGIGSSPTPAPSPRRVRDGDASPVRATARCRRTSGSRRKARWITWMGSAGAPMKLTMPTMVWAPAGFNTDILTDERGLQIRESCGWKRHRLSLLARGSSTSRNPSPRKFRASSVSVMRSTGENQRPPVKRWIGLDQRRSVQHSAVPQLSPAAQARPRRESS